MGSTGWGTWIRTKTGGVRVRCPTVRRSPSCFTISSKEMRFTSSRAVMRARSLREGCSSRRVPNLARFLAVHVLELLGRPITQFFARRIAFPWDESTA